MKLNILNLVGSSAAPVAETTDGGASAVAKSTLDDLKAGDSLLLRATRGADGAAVDFTIEADDLGVDEAGAKVAGAADERARISGILSADAAKARPKAALALAMSDAAMSVDAASTLLGQMPEEAKAVAGGLSAAMEASAPNPNIGVGGDPTASGDETPTDEANGMLAAAAKAGLPMAKTAA